MITRGVLLALLALGLVAVALLWRLASGPERPAAGSAACGEPATPIHRIRGPEPGSGLTGPSVVVEGVVTADFRDGLSGIFVQDAGGPETPGGGIFVYLPTVSDHATAELEPGDRLRLSAQVGEFQGVRQLILVDDLARCDTGVTLSPRELQLPLEPDERWDYLGMLLTLPQDLVVTDNFLLGRFGMLTVAEGGRLYHPNNGNVAGAPEDIRADNERRRLIVDDGSKVQNPEQVPFLEPGETIRAGDTMHAGVTGVLSYSRPAAFDASGPKDFRVHVIDTDQVTFEATNPRPHRPAAAANGEVDLNFAAFNVLNYFVTYPSENANARGAQDEGELARQRAKLIAAIEAIDADILGLVEIENEAVIQADRPHSERRSAAQDLVGGLNEAYGQEIYRAMPDPEFTGTDAIRQAIIYKPERFTFLAAASDGDPSHTRPPIAGTFRRNDWPYAALSVIVVHHKSKRCSEGWEDDPETQFEGCFNRLRQAQSAAAREFAAELKEAHSLSDVLLLGDVNAYQGEEPIQILGEQGLVNLNLHVPDRKRYSFVFQGEAGTLDYAFASDTLAEQVTGAELWHINADEPRVLSFEQVRYGPYQAYHDDSRFRSSDHDPVIVAAALEAPDLNEAMIGDVGIHLHAGALAPEQAQALLEPLEEARQGRRAGEHRQAAAAVRELKGELAALAGETGLSDDQLALIGVMAEAEIELLTED